MPPASLGGQNGICSQYSCEDWVLLQFQRMHEVHWVDRENHYGQPEGKKGV